MFLAQLLEFLSGSEPVRDLLVAYNSPVAHHDHPLRIARDIEFVGDHYNGHAALVETRNAGVGQVIENQRILELPLNGRQVSDLITAVNNLSVKQGNTNSMLAKLNEALAKLSGQSAGQACGPLGAFINETGALVRRGTLTSEQASAFTSHAEGIIQSLSGDAGGGTSQE